MAESKKNKLGKGLNVLFQEEESELKDATITGETPEIDVDLIDPNPHQPREIFDDSKIEELAESIKENGIIQPPTVTKKDDGRFELIAGERRLRAAKLAGLKKIPVIIKKDVSEKNKSIYAVIENIQRADLKSIEIARSYKKMLDTFNLTQDELAKKLGINRSVLANYLRLLKMPNEVIQMMDNDEISFGHAKILAGISEGSFCVDLAKKIKEFDLSVKELTDLIKKKQEEVPTPNKSQENEKIEENVSENKNNEKEKPKKEEKKDDRLNMTIEDGKIIIVGNLDELKSLYNKIKEML